MLLCIRSDKISSSTTSSSSTSDLSWEAFNKKGDKGEEEADEPKGDDQIERF